MVEGEEAGEVERLAQELAAAVSDVVGAGA
jgi:hypothetical protein